MTSFFESKYEAISKGLFYAERSDLYKDAEGMVKKTLTKKSRNKDCRRKYKSVWLCS